MNTVDIVIVGGGMVGATLACALAERHWQVAVVEARPPQPFDPEADWDLRVSAISRASQRIFEHLGLWPAMQAMRVSPYDRMVVWEEGGGEIRFDAAEMAEPDLGHVIENRVIQLAAWQRFLPSGPLALLPLSDARQCSIVWSADRPLADELMALDDAAFSARLQAAFGDRLGRLQVRGRRAAFPLLGRQAAHYARPRLALVGDAAHTIHPLAGQGVNLGLLDAADLAGRLQPGRDPGAWPALRAYERARRSEDVLMMRAMEGFRYLFGNDLTPLRLLRGTGLALADRLPPLKQAFMRQALGLRRDLPELARVQCR